METTFMTQRSNYGFYALKAAYPGNLAKGLLIGLAFHSVVILGYGFGQLTGSIKEAVNVFYGENVLVSIPQPPAIRPPVQIPQVDRPANIADIHRIPIVVEDDPVSLITTIPTQGDIIAQVPDIQGTHSDGPIEIVIRQELDNLEEPSETEVLSDPPYPLMMVKPEYPSTAKLAGLEGRVFIRGLIDVDGNVLKTQYVSGDEMFYSAASDAMRATKFKPGVNGGRAVKVWVTMPFVFRMR